MPTLERMDEGNCCHAGQELCWLQQGATMECGGVGARRQHLQAEQGGGSPLGVMGQKQQLKVDMMLAWCECSTDVDGPEQ